MRVGLRRDQHRTYQMQVHATTLPLRARGDLRAAPDTIDGAPESGKTTQVQMSRILLVGGDADFNVGDAAIRHALCATLVRADPGARITIVSDARRDAAPPPGVVRILPK